MTSKIIFSLFSLIAVYSIFSCSKEGPPGPQGPPGDSGVYVHARGDIRGKVIVYDSSGKVLADHSGVIVTIDSTGLADTTDASGAYSFIQVPVGRYNFSYSKEGYGTYRIIRQLHPGGAQATQLADADVGQIYFGPPVEYVTYEGFGGPENHDIYPYALFQAPMQIPAALVLYYSIGEPSRTNFVASTRDYVTTDQYPTSYFNFINPISTYIIFGDSVLRNANVITFSLAFDNPRDIHYTDEQGRIIYPCTSPILGSFGLSPSTFTPPFEQGRKRNDDGIYPLLRNFRLR